ncbi:F-box only protein 40 [Conger conger]|uniref:F-box only protein 40 n=1 Tax=Conger conger TaxID=82655 RepID=UPI002A59F019|nr:F-box only protein 40 [Conger conger]
MDLWAHLSPSASAVTAVASNGRVKEPGPSSVSPSFPCIPAGGKKGRTGKQKKPVTGHHVHCETCFNRHCKVPVELSVSCVVISCRLLCGAVFHICKQEEHQLLCPLDKVPCLNAANGCPFTMRRQRLAKHLETCPASVVTCSLDWNRWPAEESDDGVFRKNVLQGSKVDEQLDLSMAVRDQALLFRSLKMEALFPELMEREEKTFPEEVEGAVGGEIFTGVASVSLGGALEHGTGDPKGEMQELTQEERDAIAKNRDVAAVESYSSWEAIFSKEFRGCQQTAKNLENELKGRDGKDQKALTNIEAGIRELATERQERETVTSVNISKSGLAPWQDGVLERLGKEVNAAEYNMYLVHHGSMLIRFGQMAACTPKEKDFVYGNLEPIEVETVRTFNIPTSYKAKRSHLKDPSNMAKREDKGVDTSDWVVSEEADTPEKDEVEMTLLCSLEKELKGHTISESVGTDGLFLDVGTQTYNFPSAPFKPDASLADITADQAPGLHVQIQTECVTRRHNKSSSAFTFLCGHTFRRDEFPSHFRNTHSDIQSCLSGWFEQRCPLAYLGCTYSQKRFRPSTHRAVVTYDQNVSAFNLRPDVPALLSEDPKSNYVRNVDSFNSLPFEILQHISSFLDSFSLSQLAQVSRLLRDICASLLQERGTVSLQWEKSTHPHGGSSWKCRKKVWQFSSLFSPVERWSFDETPSMSEHLKVCPFYQTQEKSEPFVLVGLSDSQEQDGEQKSLVHTFLSNKQHQP